MSLYSIYDRVKIPNDEGRRVQIPYSRGGRGKIPNGRDEVNERDIPKDKGNLNVKDGRVWIPNDIGKFRFQTTEVSQMTGV